MFLFQCINEVENVNYQNGELNERSSTIVASNIISVGDEEQ